MTAERSIQLSAISERGAWLIRERYLLTLLPLGSYVESSDPEPRRMTREEALEENAAAHAMVAQELQSLALES